MVTHGAIGALIGEQTASAGLAFILGLVSHYFLDIIPHGDDDSVETFKTESNFRKVLGAIMMDSVLGIIFLLLYFTNTTKSGVELWPVVAGIAGAVIPDLLVGFYYVNKKYFFRHNFFHLKIHDLIKVHVPFRVAFAVQIVVIILLWNFYKF